MDNSKGKPNYTLSTFCQLIKMLSDSKCSTFLSTCSFSLCMASPRSLQVHTWFFLSKLWLISIPFLACTTLSVHSCLWLIWISHWSEYLSKKFYNPESQCAIIVVWSTTPKFLANRLEPKFKDNQRFRVDGIDNRYGRYIKVFQGISIKGMENLHYNSHSSKNINIIPSSKLLHQ